MECAIDVAIGTLTGEIDVVCFAIKALEQRNYENAQEETVRKAAHAFMDGLGRRLIDLQDKLYAIERLA